MKTWFEVAIYGQNSALAEMKASLIPAVAKRPDGKCDFVLNVAQVFPDVRIRGDAALALTAQDWYTLLEPSPFSSKSYKLEFNGNGDRDTWFAFLDRLSTEYPATTIRFSGATDHGEYEEWMANGFERTIISAYYKAVNSGLTIVYVREGVTFDPPKIEVGKENWRETPVIISASDLIRICESEWHFFFPGCDCPGVKSGTLFTKAEKFANRGLNHNDPPSAEFVWPAQEIVEIDHNDGEAVIPNDF